RHLWETRGLPFPGAAILANGIPEGFAAQVAASDEAARALRARFNLGDGPVALFLGRLHERKGLQYLIPAFVNAHSAHPAARLLIAGPDAGMRAQAEALARQSGIAEPVVFAGMLEGEDRLAALRAADVFALPAVGEGLSMAALEAMAAGLALVLTPGCNLPELDARGAGLTVARDADALAGALAALLGDDARRTQMGERGRAWVAEAFTWPAIAAQSEQVYHEAMNPDSRRARR
ncbi:MAG: glycosyltransferase, partial [Anaerolineae bacterium]|nr:glycosyltransferase [Anaerolineae bacterium]